jgi:hypothetical protein
LTKSVFEVEVTSIRSVDIDRRLRELQEATEQSIEIGVQVVAMKECEDGCEDPAVPGAYLTGYQDALTKSVDTCNLKEEIQLEASSRGVPKLENVATVPQSSRVVSSSIEIIKPTRRPSASPTCDPTSSIFAVSSSP